MTISLTKMKVVSLQLAIWRNIYNWCVGEFKLHNFHMKDEIKGRQFKSTSITFHVIEATLTTGCGC